MPIIILDSYYYYCCASYQLRYKKKRDYSWFSHAVTNIGGVFPGDPVILLLSPHRDATEKLAVLLQSLWISFKLRTHTCTHTHTQWVLKICQTQKKASLRQAFFQLCENNRQMSASKQFWLKQRRFETGTGTLRSRVTCLDKWVDHRQAKSYRSAEELQKTELILSAGLLFCQS